MLWSGLRDMARMGLSVPFAYHLALRCKSCKNKTKQNKNSVDIICRSLESSCQTKKTDLLFKLRYHTILFLVWCGDFGYIVRFLSKSREYKADFS